MPGVAVAALRGARALRHNPGHAQVDFWRGVGGDHGGRAQDPLFAMDLPNSDSVLCVDVREPDIGLWNSTASGVLSRLDLLIGGNRHDQRFAAAH